LGSTDNEKMEARPIFLLRRFLFLLQTDNAGVGLIGALGEDQQVEPLSAQHGARSRVPLIRRLAVLRLVMRSRNSR